MKRFYFSDITIDEVKNRIKEGYDINEYASEYHFTGLHKHSYMNNDDSLEIVKLLLANGANVNAIDNDGNTPLHYVRNVEIAKLLVEAGANINAKNEFGHTSLYYAKRSQQKEVIDYLTSLEA